MAQTRAVDLINYPEFATIQSCVKIWPSMREIPWGNSLNFAIIYVYKNVNTK